MPRFKRELQGWPHSAQSVAFKEDGTFYVDLHDYNPATDNDYAWTAYVLRDDVALLQAKLEAFRGCRIGAEEDLLQTLADAFTNSRQLVDWLESEAVPFVTRSDPWAALDPDDGP